MPRGQPDYGPLAPKTATASVSDMGEIAARLGSPVVYDKRGDVVFYDDFEDPVLKWRLTGAVPGGYVRHDSTSVRSGAQALRFYVPGSGNDNISVYRGIGVLASKSLGLEFSFSYLRTNCHFRVALIYYDGENIHQAEVKIDASALDLSVYNSAAGWTQVASWGALYGSEMLFHTVKMVVDFDTDKYKRLLFGPDEYDVSTVAVLTDTNTTAPHINIRPLLATLDSAVGYLIGLDDVILTQEEP